MMTRLHHLLAAVLLLLSAPLAGAQVDVAAISKSVKSNPTAFRSVLNRFIAGDTKLTDAQQQQVYYGFPYSAGATATQPDQTRLDAAYNAGQYPSALVMAEEALKHNPVSLDLTIKAMVSAGQCADARSKAKLPALQARYDMLVNTILHSGRGTELHSPFIVNTRSDQFRILRNVLQVAKIIGYSNIAGCSAAKFLMPGDSQEHILYFKILH